MTKSGEELLAEMQARSARLRESANQRHREINETWKRTEKPIIYTILILAFLVFACCVYRDPDILGWAIRIYLSWYYPL